MFQVKHTHIASAPYSIRRKRAQCRFYLFHKFCVTESFLFFWRLSRDSLKVVENDEDNYADNGGGGGGGCNGNEDATPEHNKNRRLKTKRARCDCGSRQVGSKVTHLNLTFLQGI